MTHDELQALPDVTPRMNYTEQIVDGRMVKIPTFSTECGALFQQPEDGVFEDANGKRWLTGWVHGVRVRREFRPN